MEFKKFSSRKASFDVTQMESEDPNSSKMDFNTNPLGLINKSKPQLVEILNDTYHAEHKPTYEVLMHLAVCHTVVVDKNKGVYNAASPDEQALVEGAKD